mgnify:CR=1 FL=1
MINFYGWMYEIDEDTYHGSWDNIGRITQWIKEDRLHKAIKFEPISSELDRFMVCGSLNFNRELIEYFKNLGLSEGNTSVQGEYLVEKAFVEK